MNLSTFAIRFNGIDWLQSCGDGFLGFERSIWPSGAKFEVSAEIDITDMHNPCALLDDSTIVKALNERYFGSLKSRGRRYRFTEEENNHIALMKSKMKPEIIAFQKRTKTDQKMNSKTEAYIDTAMVRFTVKKPLKMFFKDWEYRYEQPGTFTVRKRLRYGFVLEVCVYFKLLTSNLTRKISISGLYFCYDLAFSQIVHSSHVVVDDFIADCRRIADEAENTLPETLFQLYGETPPWFF